MNIYKMELSELEKLSYLDIAYNIIKQNKEMYKTVDLLKEVCKLLNYGDKEFENLIGDFYTSLNLDKRFILIDSSWDLAENHVIKVVVEDELDEDDEEISSDEEDVNGEIEDDIVSDELESIDDDIDDDIDDELEDMSIIDEEEEEEI